MIKLVKQLAHDNVVWIPQWIPMDMTISMQHFVAILHRAQVAFKFPVMPRALGKKVNQHGNPVSVTWHTILGIIVDLFWKRVARSKWFHHVTWTVGHVSVHHVIQWQQQEYERQVVRSVDVSEAMRDHGKGLVIAARHALGRHGAWLVKKGDQDVTHNGQEGAVDAVVENAQGNIGLLDVKVQPFGQAESVANRQKLRGQCAEQWQSFEGPSSLPAWTWGLLLAFYAKVPGEPSSSDYAVLDVWARDDSSKVQSFTVRNIYKPASILATAKPALCPWQQVKAKLSVKDSSLRRGCKLYFKLVEYLNLTHEQDASGHLSRWAERGFVDQDSHEEVIRSAGASKKLNSHVESKGGKEALFIRCTTLRAIHKARLAGRL